MGTLERICRNQGWWDRARKRSPVLASGGSSRGAAAHAVLAGESYLNELEAAAKRLRDIEAGRAVPADSFKLVGSGRLAAAVEDPIAQIRRDATVVAEKKLTSLAE